MRREGDYFNRGRDGERKGGVMSELREMTDQEYITMLEKDCAVLREENEKLNEKLLNLGRLYNKTLDEIEYLQCQLALWKKVGEAASNIFVNPIVPDFDGGVMMTENSYKAMQELLVTLKAAKEGR